MKKFLLIFSLLMMSEIIFASLPPSNRFSDLANKNAKNIMVPIGGTKNAISLYDLSRIDKNSFEKLTGKKMNFFERWSFKTAQKKLQKSITKDGYIQNEKLAKELTTEMYERGNGGSGFHFGGFALGFFLGLMGVLIAYLAFNRNDVDLRRRRITWAWFGWSIWIALLILTSLH